MSISLKEIGEFLGIVISITGQSYTARDTTVLAPLCEKLGLVNIVEVNPYGITYKITERGMDAELDWRSGSGFADFQKLAKTATGQTVTILSAKFANVAVPPVYEKVFDIARKNSL